MEVAQVKDRKNAEYRDLPAELKLMIWTLVFSQWSPGAHRFRLTQDPETKARLVMKPDNIQKRDASAWRERRALMCIDRYALDCFRKIQRGTITLYKDTLHRHRVLVEENGAVAMVDAAADLVTFRFNYGVSAASLALLNPVANKRVFAGIEKIGVEIEFFTKGFSLTKKYKPFQYHRHDIYPSLTGAIVDFMDNFRDLKTFYIICPAINKYIHRRIPASPPEPQKLAPLEPPKWEAAMPQSTCCLFRRLQGKFSLRL